MVEGVGSTGNTGSAASTGTGRAEIAAVSESGDGAVSRRGFLSFVGMSAAGASLVMLLPGGGQAAAVQPPAPGPGSRPAATIAGAGPSTDTAKTASTADPASAALSVDAAAFAAVFLEGQKLRFDIAAPADAIKWTLRDVWGSPLRSGVEAVRGGRAGLTLPKTAKGYYTLDVTATKRGAEVANATTSFAVLPKFGLPADSPFGLNTHLQPAEMAPLLATLGVTWARTDLTWTDIEPPPLAGWTTDIYQAQATIALDTTVGHSGTSSVKITNASPIAPNFYATIAQAITVQPATTYTFTAWVKGENVAEKALQFSVANDWGARVDAPSGTFDWTKVTWQYTTGTESTFNFRLLSSDVTGAAWLDDVSIVAAGSTTNLVANPGFEQGLATGYTFDTFGPYLDALAKAKVNPLPILDYANPKYDNGDTVYDDAGRAAFSAYTTAVMKHWKGRFKAVEVYNEWNAGWFTTGPADADPGYYAQLLATTHDAIKAVDPKVQVVGGVTYGTDIAWLTKVFDAGGMDHLDAVSNHPYMGAPESGTPLDVQEEAVTALIEQYNGGKAKPVWISELGWSLGSELTTAGYLVRGIVLALAGGVAKFFWYDLVGDQNFGLLNQAGDSYSPRPVFVAYATAIRQLTGMELHGGGQVGTTAARCYGFTGRRRDDIAVVWSTDAHTPVAIRTTRPLTVLDMTGSETVMSPWNGSIHLTLTGAPLYLRGAGLAARTDLVAADATIDVTAPALVQTADGNVPLTYVLDNSAGPRSAELLFSTAGKTTRVKAAAGQRAEIKALLPVAGLPAGRNTLITIVSDGHRVVGRLVSDVVVIDVPAGAIATVGTVDWSDAEFALAPGNYGGVASNFPNGVTFTAGTDSPATGWPYIHPGPDDGWAGGHQYTYTVNFPLDQVPPGDLQLVVFLLDTHNTAPGTVGVTLNGGAATSVALPAGSGSGYADGNAFTSGDQPTQFSVRLPASGLKTGTNSVAITKTSGSWMVYDAVGVYPA